MEQESESLVMQQPRDFVVAIGASAGGLEAIHQFFDNMPEDVNLSFVIIQHLSADYKSLLVELVSKHTRMHVVEAMHDTALEPNYVYVIPNNKLLMLKEGKLQLSNKVLDKSPNTAIDTFLKSLAKDKGDKAIAVILSGTGTDGTRGIEAIQQQGGMVVVQDPASARFDGMPNSAIAAGYADYILSPDRMPAEIINYIKEKPGKELTEGQPNEEALPEIMKLIERSCGYDFHNYKSPTILRRITRRMNQLEIKNFSDYLEHLRSSNEECKTLGKEFLIGVTKFFRDSGAFEIFTTEVLPEVVRMKSDGDVLKVWVTACSTGQEAYSIAILINEYLRTVKKSIEVKIFATDIDLDAIETASKGVYPEAAVSDMSPEYLQRYFIRQGTNYIPVPLIRKQIVFARHNILRDPPFIKNDIISCRNMLIYMNSILQRKVFATLQYSLNTGGYLFLGPSEIPSSISSLLSEVSNKWKIYRKISSENHYQPAYDATHSYMGTRELRMPSKDATSTAKELAEEFKNILTEEFKFAAIYIDRNYEIKEAVGDFRSYLSLPDKIVNLNVLKMVEQDLAVALNAAIRKALKDQQRVTLNNIRLKGAEKERLVNIYVKPAMSKDGKIAIVFGESHVHDYARPPHDYKADSSIESINYITELEEELKETKTNLQLAIESLETTNEELQSSNEELLSANEELQSSNEELQSLNEELHTLNTEHQLRIKELIELNDDLNNYFRSTKIAQLFVDGNLRIRKFNPAAVQMINLIETDIGRPIDHISHNISESSFLQDIRHVMDTGDVIEKEVETTKNVAMLMRIIPYIRQDKKVDGVVITFFDISAIKRLNNIISGVFNSTLSIIMAFKAVRNEKNKVVDYEWISGNHAADKFLNKSNDAYIGASLKRNFSSLLENGLEEKFNAVVSEDIPLHTQLKLENNGSNSWYELVATKMMDGLVLTLTDITEKKESEEKLKKSYDELLQVKENLKSLNASLEEKVEERTRELRSGEERFRLIADAANDVVWDWDLNNKVIWWSESFYKRFGFEHQANAFTSESFWYEHIHPEDRERVMGSVNESKQKGGNWSEEYRFRKADDNYALILDKGCVVKDDQGHAYRMVGAMTDITLAKRTELQLEEKHKQLQVLLQQFTFVTDFMPQMVWATKPDGYHDFYNKQWYDYTGLTYEQTKAEGWNDVLHPDDKDRAWKVWRHSLETGEPYEIEYRFRRYDGEYRWFLGRALPLKDDKGQITKWFGTCTDIHDQRTMNDTLELKIKERTEELLAANIELEATNTELMQFASVASHDLKEPLRKIHMFSNIVKDRYLADSKEGAMDYMNRIINSSARMTRLINDLLAYSRLSMNHFFEDLDLNIVMSEVLSDLELFILEKKAQIDVDRLPVIEAIPGQIRQVLQNIISNSLKFTRADNHPHIIITSVLIDEPSFDAPPNPEGKYCRIKIKDNGIGFDEQYASKIFTIFQRLHSREKYDGTGIGLAITKKIIDRHNGLITASSEENKGSTFTIILPLKQEETEKDDVNELAENVTPARK